MAIATLLAALVLGQAGQAGELVKQIDEMREPPYPGGSDEAVAAWFKACDAFAEEYSDKVLKLYALEPANATVPKFLSLRYSYFEGHRMPPEKERLDRIAADVDQFLSKNPLEPNREVMLRFKFRAQALSQWRAMKDAKLKSTDPESKPYLEAGLRACDAFNKLYPKVSAGVYTYYNYSQMARGTDFEKVALRRIIQRYPDHDLGFSSKGKLRLMESLNKPIALAFKDVTTGKRIDIKDYRGRVVLIDFWATWCGPCRIDIEENMLTLAKRLEPEGLSIIGISADAPEADGGKASLLKYIQEKGISWPNSYDGKPVGHGVSGEWGISAYPTQFLVDRKGRLRYTSVGEDREKVIRQLLDEKS